MIVGGASPLNTPPAGNGHALNRGCRRVRNGGKVLIIPRLDDGVDHITAHHHVADVPLDRDGRADGSSVGLKVLDELGVDEDVVHALAEEHVARPGRGHEDHVVGLATDEEVAHLGAGHRVNGRRGREGIRLEREGREVGGIAADPDIADLPGCECTAREHVGDQVGSAWQEGGLRRGHGGGGELRRHQ